jgi:hypothetical protein
VIVTGAVFPKRQREKIPLRICAVEVGTMAGRKSRQDDLRRAGVEIGGRIAAGVGIVQRASSQQASLKSREVVDLYRNF